MPKRRAIGDAGNISHVPVTQDSVVAKAKCIKENCKMCKTKGSHIHYMICYPKKHVKAIINFFKLRCELHETVYQHKATSGVQYMICDILEKADVYLPFKGLPISRACLDPAAYLEMTDSIIGE
jgi:HD superfamily phosphohydrolase